MFDNDFELPSEPVELITEKIRNAKLVQLFIILIFLLAGLFNKKPLAIEAEIEEDQKCNADLDAGLAQLFTCIKPWNDCKVGNRYHVRIDNLASDLSDQWSGTPFEKFVQDIPVVYWVYIDSGLGTPKKRVIFNGNFSEYFA